MIEEIGTNSQWISETEKTQNSHSTVVTVNLFIGGSVNKGRLSDGTLHNEPKGMDT